MQKLSFPTSVLILILTTVPTLTCRHQPRTNSPASPPLAQEKRSPPAPLALTLQDPDPREIKKHKRYVESWLKVGRQRRLYYSVQVGVLLKGKLVYEKYYRTNPKRRYSLASVTKTFTGLSAMQLAEEGKLNLEAPVTHYFPRFKFERSRFNSKPALVKHMLSHSSGLPDLRSFRRPGWLNARKSGVGFKIPRQSYPTGYYYAYSNRSMKISGKIVEKAGQTTLRRHFQTRILDPLGMKHTKLASSLSGASGVQTNLRDFAKYAAMWLNKGKTPDGKVVLGEAQVNKMLQPIIYYPEEGKIHFMGLSWKTKRSKNGVWTFYHVGGFGGTMSWIQMFPQHDAAILYLGDPPRMDRRVLYWLDPFRERLANLAGAYAGAVEPLPGFEPSPPTPQLLQNIAGRYKDVRSKYVYKFEVKGNKLYWVRGRRRILMEAKSSREFKAKGKTYLFSDFVFEPGKQKPVGMATPSAYCERI